MTKKTIIAAFLALVVLSSHPILFAQDSGGSTTTPNSVPRVITFNGILRDVNGQPMNGVVGVTFALYKEQEGGTPLWTENQNVQVDEQGRYVAVLGSTQSEGLPVDMFASGEPRWFGVQAQVSGAVEHRAFLVSVPYALHAADADTVGGKPVSAFVLRPDSTEASTNGSSKLVKGPTDATIAAVSGIGTAGRVTKWTDGAGTLGDAAILDNTTSGVSITMTDNSVAVGKPLQVNGEVRNTSSPEGAPFTQARLTAYRDAGNWGYIGYGSDGIMRLVYGNTAVNSPLLVGTTSAPDNTGTFTERMKLTNTGQLLINGEFWNSAASDGAPYTRPRLTAYKDATNWGYISYGADAIMRLVFGNTAGNAPLLIGTTSAPDNTGTFTEKMKLTHDGQLLLNGEFYNTTSGDPAPYTKARLTAYRDATNWGYIGYGNDAAMRVVYSSTAGNFPLLFGTTTATDNTGAFTEKMRLSGSGNLGLGNTNPTTKIDVTGDVRASGQLMSSVAPGTPPLAVNSTTVVPNLNADLLDGYNGVALATRGINYLAGCDSCSTLTTNDSQTDFYVNVVGAMTINLVKCFSNGQPQINILRRHAAQADALVLSSNLQCSSSGATGTLNLTTLNVDDELDFQVKTVDNVATRVTLVIKTTLN